MSAMNEILSIDQMGEFFAPASSDMINGLIGQYRAMRMRVEQDDDAQTLQKMQVFDRFSLGFPVFWNGDAYRLDARLRYRVRDGKLTFWFELIRQDKVLEAATQTLIAQIREKTGNPFFFGEPFAQQ